jgi:predicted Zn finger-like uncharacterized protein
VPRFTCPNCFKHVRVQDHQLGKVLRCSNCGGRFLADPGLPPAVYVQNFSGEAPPVQHGGEGVGPPPGGPGAGQTPPHYPGALSPAPAEEDAEPSDITGWLWFCLLCALEVAIGFLLIKVRARLVVDAGLFGSVFALPSELFLDETGRALLIALRVLLLIHEVTAVAALLWAAWPARAC